MFVPVYSSMIDEHILSDQFLYDRICLLGFFQGKDNSQQELFCVTIFFLPLFFLFTYALWVEVKFKKLIVLTLRNLGYRVCLNNLFCVQSRLNINILKINLVYSNPSIYIYLEVAAIPKPPKDTLICFYDTSREFRYVWLGPFDKIE